MKKYSLLIKKIINKEKLAIAFSGGVDSSLLAYSSKYAGIDVLLITVNSPLFSAHDKKTAEQIAHELGLHHIIIDQPLEKDIVKNETIRCFYCKREEAKIWIDIAKEHGFSIVADGANFDDVKDRRRPGIRAYSELGIWHPFAESKITKKDVRFLAKKFGLSFWNRPSNACLASRIMFGEEITLEKLQMIEKAEDFLRDLSPQVRVHLHKNSARIEVPIDFINNLVSKREEIVDYLKKIGFIYITLDLEGYRSGSMHEETN